MPPHSGARRAVENFFASVCVPIAIMCPLDRVLALCAVVYVYSWYYGAAIPGPSEILSGYILWPFFGMWHKVGGWFCNDATC